MIVWMYCSEPMGKTAYQIEAGGDIWTFFSDRRIGVNYIADEENYTPSNFLGSEGLSRQDESLQLRSLTLDFHVYFFEYTSRVISTELLKPCQL